MYAERAKVMGEALVSVLRDAVMFTQPQGGLFFWARLTGWGGKVKNAGEFAERAIEQGVAFVPGAPFNTANSEMATFRFSFATAGVVEILEWWGGWGRRCE